MQYRSWGFESSQMAVSFFFFFFLASVLIIISLFIVYFLKERYSRNWPFTAAQTVFWKELQVAEIEEYRVMFRSRGAAVGLFGLLVNKNIPMLWAVSTKTDNTPCGLDVPSFLLSLQTPPVML